MTGSASLQGVRVVVTAPRGSRLGAQLRARGAEVIECPTIAIADPTTAEQLDSAIEEIGLRRFDWILFTSKNGVERFFERWEQLGGRAYGPLATFARIGAVGDATTRLLSESGVEAELVPKQFTGSALADAIGKGSGRVLAVRAEGAPRQAIDALEVNGWTVADVAAYRTVPGDPDQAAIDSVRSGAYEAVAFTSGSTATNLVQIAGAPENIGLAPEQDGPLVACIGPETAEVARSKGFRVDLIAEPHTNDGLVQALLARFADR